MWNITEFPLVRIFTPSFWNRFILENINIYAPRQRRWIIDATKPIIHDRRADPNVPYPIMKQSSIRGLLFRYRHNPKNKSLMFHLHGGGFISQSPESHACYLVKWVRKLDGLFCIDLIKKKIKLMIHFFRYTNFKRRLFPKSTGNFS